MWDSIALQTAWKLEDCHKYNVSKQQPASSMVSVQEKTNHVTSIAVAQLTAGPVPTHESNDPLAPITSISSIPSPSVCQQWLGQRPFKGASSLTASSPVLMGENSACNFCHGRELNNSELSIWYYSARSILPKLEELRLICASEKPDIVCIVETWVDNAIEDNELCWWLRHCSTWPQQAWGRSIIVL